MNDLWAVRGYICSMSAKLLGVKIYRKRGFA